MKAVLFDMDGVLTDSEPVICAAAMAYFEENGIQVKPSDFDPFVGAGESRYIGGVAEKYGFPIDESAAKQRVYEIYLSMVPGRLQAFSGAVELVQACHTAGLKTAVASSADRIKVEANLREIGLKAEYLDAIITSESVTTPKPAPDIFLAAARSVGVAPEDCVVIEDAVNGIRAARTAGMYCIAVAQSFPPDKLTEANLIRNSIGEIKLEEIVHPPSI